MNNCFTYDQLYGTLISQNEADTERTYFIFECEYYKFYKWMFKHGWNKIRAKPCERKGLRGFEVTLTKSIPAM